MLDRFAAVVFAAALSHALAAAGPILVWPDREQIEPAQDDVAKKRAGVGRAIDISAQTKIDAHFFITTKGNGVVTLPGLAVRIYDDHGDGTTFQGGLLRCEWRDETATAFSIWWWAAGRTTAAKRATGS